MLQPKTRIRDRWALLVGCSTPNQVVGKRRQRLTATRHTESMARPPRKTREIKRTSGQALEMKAACDIGREENVAERQDTPYQSGDVEIRIKVKFTETESFAVIGYEAVRGGIQSLRVAHLVDGVLKPAGLVGSGLTHETARELWTALERGKPIMVDVEFGGWTPAGELRHAVFKGWHQG